MMINPTRFIPIAKEIAKLQLELYPNKKFHHVSVIVFGKSFVVGINGEKSHPDIIPYGRERILLHSEMAAFIKVKNLTDKDLTLINFRFNRKLQLRLSKPCKDCMKWCRVEFNSIYFSTNNGKIERMY
ncbi:MAG: hypothetical protein KDH96_04455 [Candidatus Riesia sp.]|nr:hypothetical protein [Candidatus Riesia sp.]